MRIGFVSWGGVFDVCFALLLIVVQFLSFLGATVTSVGELYALKGVLFTMQLWANAVRSSTPSLQSIVVVW
jgi:hypothetical protein